MDLPQRKSIRLSGYDYSQDGWYYITICTQNRANILGKIENGKMFLDEAGKIVDKNWLLISKKFGDINLDIYQIMPNHLHGIIEIVGAGSSRPQPTLGKILAYFKYETTKQINSGAKTAPETMGAKTAPLQKKQMFPKIWQRNYYEHIIRNKKELFAIREYIKSNPSNWDKDRNNPISFK